MYNFLVENCFEKCVNVGWGGVSSFCLYLFYYLNHSIEFENKTFRRRRKEMYLSMRRKIHEINTKGWFSINRISSITSSSTTSTSTTTTEEINK